MELFTEKATFIEKRNSTLTQDAQALLVRFKLMSAETKNENKRVYPRQVLAKAVEDLRVRLAKRKSIFALNTHKDDEEVDDISAVLEDVEMTGNDVFATARVLPTQRGKNVQAILRHGGSIGVSAKCYGAVDEAGRVKPGLILKGFDFVTSPGFGTYATAANIIESVTVEDENNGSVILGQLKEWGLVEDGQVAEATLKERYRFALESGYKGTLEQYLQSVHSISREK
jgi:hypothetical protein